MDALPSGLSVADLAANPPCRFFIFSKVKRGPRVVWACSFCWRLRKTPTCVVSRP